MNKHDVRSSGDALAYIVDCTLATVCGMASNKRRHKYEYERQVSIAQSGLGWLRDFGIDLASTRAQAVVDEFGGSVAAWAAQYHPKV